MTFKRHHVYRIILLIACFISISLIRFVFGTSTLPLGQIYGIVRNEDAKEIRVVITAEKARIKLFFVKGIPYESPSRIDVRAKDVDGHDLLYSPDAILNSIPDSVFKNYNLPYYHE